MNFAYTTVGFAAVAFQAKQLNIGSIAASTAGKRRNVVELQIQGTSTTLANASIPGINDLLGGGGNVPTLGKSQAS